MDNNNRLILPTERQPTRADALKNRALLLETAQRLFATHEDGVNGVSMSDIADAAGVGKGTLYRHFRNKGELCHALLDEDMRDLQERFLRRMRMQATPLQNLEWFLEQVVYFVTRNEQLLYPKAPDTTVNILQHPAHLWWRQTIRGLLQQLKPAGDLDYLSDVFYVMIDVNTLRFQRHVLGYDLPRIIEGLHTLLHSVAA